MYFYGVSTFLTLLVCQSTLGTEFGQLLRSGKSYTGDTNINEMPPQVSFSEDSESDGLQDKYGLVSKNVTEGYRLDEKNMDSTVNGISTSIADNNNQTHIEDFSKEIKNANISTTHNIIGNSTSEFSTYSPQAQSSSESSTNANGKNSTSSISLVTQSIKSNQSSMQTDEESEKVVIGRPSNSSSAVITAAQPKTIYQRTLELINDTYTLSILLPVAAGIVFASTIIVVIATCRCIKRQCRHRRLRKKTLPDSVKNLRPSDRARLLAESSDEEF